MKTLLCHLEDLNLVKVDMLQCIHKIIIASSLLLKIKDLKCRVFMVFHQLVNFTKIITKCNNYLL